MIGLALWGGAAGAANDDADVLEQYRRANVLPAEEIAPVAPEVREAYLAALAIYDEAVASKDPKHPGFKQAREAWEPLADGGDPASTYHLGMLHLFGLGGAAFDQLDAFRKIETAAEHRYPPAQTFMGLLAERGDGLIVALDAKLALEWYAHGALGGHCAAVRRLVKAYEQAELGVAADAGKAGEWRGRLDGCRKR
jgi:TPR repeat protein